jgi:hypothetical protein
MRLELETVRLKRQIGDVPAGTVGTIVHVYPKSAAYIAEFTIGDTIDDHWHAVETVEDADIENVPCV